MKTMQENALSVWMSLEMILPDREPITETATMPISVSVKWPKLYEVRFRVSEGAVEFRIGPTVQMRLISNQSNSPGIFWGLVCPSTIQTEESAPTAYFSTMDPKVTY